MALVDGGTPLRDELTPSALQHKSIAPSLTLTASRNPRARTRKLLEANAESINGYANTQIVCTIGPKTNSVDALVKLIKAGMSVARLNFSHGTYEYHGSVITNVREASKQTNRPVAIMLDTKGPEIRTGKLRNGQTVELKAGQAFKFITDMSYLGDENGVACTYAKLAETVKPGGRILVEDGNIQFQVNEIVDGEVRCTVVNNAVLGQTKGTNLPGCKVELPSVTEKDKEDIAFGVEQNVDLIAASWIRTAQNIVEIRNLPNVKEAGIKIIAKIESQEGLDNFDDILSVSDGIMVARGDLGTEIPIEKIANAQKMMIRRCNMVGKPVITATQMLDSMIRNPRPTRAEATDVANAVYDGSDCVMLSGETANGSYPTEAVLIMDKICVEAESEIDYRSLYREVRGFTVNEHLMSVTESIASSAVKSAYDLDAAAIIVLTDSGQSARFVSKYRPHVPIIVVTSSSKTTRQCLISRGTIPILVESMQNSQKLIAHAIEWAKAKTIVSSGDRVIVTSGNIEGISGSTNIMKVESVA